MTRTHPVGEADVERLADALVRLAECQEPADLIYNAAVPLSQERPTAAAAVAVAGGEDYSITLARRVSTLVGRLDELAQPARQRVLTPRGVLLELMDIVQHGLFSALPPSMREVGDGPASIASAFRTYISTRCVPVDAMMEGLHALTYVSVKLRVELVTLQLRRRLQEEMADLAEVPESEERLAALLVTETLLEDFTNTYENTLLTIPVVTAAAQATLGLTAGHPSPGGGDSARPTTTTMMRGPAMDPGATNLFLSGQQALASLLPALRRYYDHLSDWTLLTASAAEVSPISFTRITRVRLDEKTGTVEVELHRPSAASPWGLLFNARGHLIGVDVSMRVGERARELHELLRCTEEGAAVAVVNDTPVRSARTRSSTTAPSAGAAVVMEALQAASHGRKRLRLVLKAPQFHARALQAPAELLFSCPPQGGEGASGQRAALLLYRLNPRAPWQFAVDGDLTWYPPPPRLLSDPVRALVRAFPYRLRVFAVNGVEVHSAAQVRDLVKGVEVLVLELYVVSIREAARAVRGGADETVPVAPPGGAVAAASEPTASVRASRTRRGRGPAISEGDNGQRHPTDTDTIAVTAERQEGTPAAGGAAAIERQVREATQRLMLSHAQRRELREVPLVGGTLDEEEMGRVAEREVPAEATGEAWTEPIAEADPSAAVDADALPEEGDGERRVGEPMERAALTAPREAEQRGPDMLPRAGVDAEGALGSAAVAEEGGSSELVQQPRRARAGKRPEKANPGVVGEGAAAAAEGGPCVFQNNVKLLSFDGREMLFRRASTDQPWGLKITQSTAESSADGREAALPLRVLALPEPVPVCAGHPFMREFLKGKPQWLIESINGKSAATDAKETLERMRKATRMSLKLLRR